MRSCGGSQTDTGSPQHLVHAEPGDFLCPQLLVISVVSVFLQSEHCAKEPVVQTLYLLGVLSVG